MMQVIGVNLKELDLKKDVKLKDNKKSSEKFGEDFTKVFNKNIKESSKNVQKSSVKEKKYAYKTQDEKIKNTINDESKEEQEHKRKIKKQAEEMLYSILGIFNQEDTMNKIKEKLKESIDILDDLASIENINKKEVLNELLEKYNLDNNGLKRILGSFISLGENQDNVNSIEKLKDEIENLLSKIEEFSKGNSTDKAQNIKGLKKFKESQNLKSIEEIKNSLRQNLVSFKEDAEDKGNTELKNENSFLSSINRDEKDFLKVLTKDPKEDKAISMDKVHLGLNKLSNLKIDNQEIAKQIKMPVINKYTFNNDIIKSIKFMNLNNLKELSVRIVPRELGELVIKVSVENGVMKANISSTTKETYQLLQNNAKEILSKLQGESIKVEEFSVDIYDQNNTANNSQNLKDRNENFNSHNQKSWKHSSNTIEDIVVEEGNRETVDIEDVINILA
ncbi:hypothetical protein C3495_04935 [Clostridiaceae bacterium 14S0207]|nr:hypothetical protein C3495_04935 [Clostridiaceae bacterium 14S0207]